MALEAATYIDSLVETNPTGFDNRAQGDDHIRLVKKVLKNTFPNVTGPMTLTQTQINALATPGVINFPGMIVMWSGQIANIPAGWKLCNGVGTISTGGAVPNLVDRFIIASATNSGGTYNIGQTGGAATVNITGNTGDHALTIDQIPAHSHTIDWGANSTSAGPNKSNYVTTNNGPNSTSSVGGGAAHKHTVNLSGSVIPPYYALAFIIKE